jgi:hypothetical protein
VHVATSEGLLDFARYRTGPAGLDFRLGAGLRLTLPPSVLERVETVTWRGLSYRAGPIELAFAPKAITYHRRPHALAPHDREDLRRMAPLVDRAFLRELARRGGLRWLGRRLPRWLDPLAPLDRIARDDAQAV